MADVTAARIAANVRAEMARVGMNGRELAGRLQISQPALSRRLRGQIAFDVAELAAVAAELGVPLTQILNGADDRTGAA